MFKVLAYAALLTMAQAAPDPHRPTPKYDSVAPLLPKGMQRAVLIVSKTNGWRHIEHITRSNAVLADIVRSLGRASYTTENAAIFNDAQLRRFSLVVLNSASGDFLTDDQHAAFARFVAQGGGVVALHAAGDNSHTAAWYRDTLIGTKFIGHPGGTDQLQQAKIVVERPDHPIMAGIKRPWSAVDEWYSFDTNPAARGMTILATIDEASYRPGAKLAMGVHPIIWINLSAKGRVFYSALGHSPDAYNDPDYQRLLSNAIRWAAR